MVNRRRRASDLGPWRWVRSSVRIVIIVEEDVDCDDVVVVVVVGVVGMSPPRGTRLWIGVDVLENVFCLETLRIVRLEDDGELRSGSGIPFLLVTKVVA